MEKAILAGGCFWGVEELIRDLPGVASTIVGYTGGDVPNATYRNHGTHAEAIEIIYDPRKIKFIPSVANQGVRHKCEFWILSKAGRFYEPYNHRVRPYAEPNPRSRYEGKPF